MCCCFCFYASFFSLVLGCCSVEWMIDMLIVYIYEVEKERSVVWSGEEKRLMSKDWKIEWSWFPFSFRVFCLRWERSVQVHHHNIHKCFCVGETQNRFFIVIFHFFCSHGSLSSFNINERFWWFGFLLFAFFKLSSYVWAFVICKKRHWEIHTFIHYRHSIGSWSYRLLYVYFFELVKVFFLPNVRLLHRHANFLIIIMYLISFQFEPLNFCSSHFFLLLFWLTFPIFNSSHQFEFPSPYFFFAIYEFRLWLQVHTIYNFLLC